ncbi:anaerobic ribonucleoside-triphosphate reductase activating protein [Massilia sp. erpn]|nr:MULTISPECIES: anaerobic ribonucleoside-triphosphate reductase activating protein [unclassified Massilia]UTY59000.1 anaerobic ribonucleoside-triphosphate reductase activating protein [Massilia sp. erpn]
MNANTSVNPVQPPAAAERSANALKVGGVTPFTATDFPGKLAMAVFVHGCPWRCGYCHNPELQRRPEQSAIAWQEVLELLERRKGLLDGVVFSGGEPTIDPALEAAIAEVKGLGYAVGLHTACIYPQRLAQILPMLDWVGFDIKANERLYPGITGVPGSGSAAWDCARRIIASGVDYECRTTVHPQLLLPEQIYELAFDLASMGVRNFVLQEFRQEGCGDAALNASALPGYPGTDLLRRIAPLFERFQWRGAA